MTRREDDGGSAIIEFVFVAVIVMVPLLYVIATVATLQRNELVVAQAAREAGRAFATADRAGDAMPRAKAAVQLALRDPDLHGITVKWVRSSCDGPAITPRLTPGTVFAVCIARSVYPPGVPRFVAGHGITAQGKYVVHVDDFRAAT